MVARETPELGEERVRLRLNQRRKRKQKMKKKEEKEKKKGEITRTTLNKLKTHLADRWKIRERCTWMISVYVILLLVINPVVNSSNQTDLLALLDFKNLITEDPFQITTSWNDSLHFCNWVGVICSPSNGRVTILNLEAKKLVGSFPPSVGNLTFLTGLNLRSNSFHGEIPQEIGRLQQLQHLNLTANSFNGVIPTNLSFCTELLVLDLGLNELTGKIPDQLSSLPRLFYLGLRSNNLTGGIPASIGNISSLYRISLSINNLEGSIPPELGGLSLLRRLAINGNQLSGMVPSSLYNISTIYYLTFADNRLHGQLPSDIGLTLPNLEIFAGGVNFLSGQIPSSFPNASRLGLIDFAENTLTGTVPRNLGNLPGLYRINFDDNQLGDGKVGNLDFIGSLINCTGLEVLGLARNRFGGELPNTIANLSTSLRVTLGLNLLHGNVPVGIGNLINLTILGLEGNYLTGSLPDSLGKLRQLVELQLSVNKFSGPIPFSLGNLTSLTRLFMEDNELEGSIPPSLGNLHSLLELNLSNNKLTGIIPKEIVSLSSLSISLALGNNLLMGSIPIEIGSLVNLAKIDFSKNRLSGEIPSTLSRCLSLEILLMGSNQLQGTIPDSLKTLKGLEEINLAQNNLSGNIPEFLATFSSLKKVNLSFNDFEGEVPSEGIFSNANAVLIRGNDKLCGGIVNLHLPDCAHHNTNSRKHFARRILIGVTSSIIFVAICSCSFAAYYMVKRSRTNILTETSTNSRQYLRISYTELVRATNGFSIDNLIGSGSFGSVYKGILSGHGGLVAVKVLNLQQEGTSKSFMSECEALRSVRHRNLLKIVTSCSTIDHQGNSFKCLVFEYMNNGSLDRWLHIRDFERNNRSQPLTLIQRMNIAIDVASALEYLHHHCETPIVHCDLKPSNILLDDDMIAHVGDFGLAKFLFQSSNDEPNISVGLRGSIGYMPPEYGMSGEVTTLGDVYSFGILLLEMITGKRPTDEIFREGSGIHHFAEMALPDRVLDIVDPSLLFAEEKHNLDENRNNKNIREVQVEYTNDTRECLYALLAIGVSCSSSLPSKRMAMNIVVNKLHEVVNSFLASQTRKKN